MGRALVDLGALTKADAVRAHGADKILFAEGSLDRQVLGQLLSRTEVTDPFSDARVIVAELPSGKGDRVPLEAFRRLLRDVLKLDMAVCCLVDNDYEIEAQGPPAERAEAGQVAVFRLSRKEAENYLIIPDVVARAASVAAERRQQRTGEELPAPSREQVAEELHRILASPEVRDAVNWQVVPTYRDRLPSNLDPATREQQAQEWFSKHWGDEGWRLRNCPGKQVLAKLRSWCQAQYKLTLSVRNLVDAVDKCPADLCEIASQLEAHFYGESSYNG